MVKSGVWTINHDDEKKIVVMHVNVRVSIVFLLIKLVLLDIFATLFAIVFFGAVSSPMLSQEIRLSLLSYNMSYLILIAVAKILLTIFLVLQWINEYYEITPAKIFYRRGILWRKEDTYTLSKINAIGMKQGIFGRIFNYGTIFFYDVGVFKYYYLNYIHNPSRYLNVLHSILPDVDIEKEVVREHIRDVEAE